MIVPGDRCNNLEETVTLLDWIETSAYIYFFFLPLSLFLIVGLYFVSCISVFFFLFFVFSLLLFI